MSTSIEVLITLPFSEELVAKIRAVSPQLNVMMYKASKAEDVPADLWQRIEILYTDQALPKPELAPLLRWIQFHWAGLDRLIDEPILKIPDLVATSLSGAAASQVAEYALMMLLALGHRIPDLFEHQKRADWPRERWRRFSPQELRGSTVGIVGYGSIGRQVGRMVHAFGATVLATKRDAMHPADPGYILEGFGDPDGDLVRRLYPPQALRSMLKECDFVVVTLPLTPETRGLIGIEELASMKPNAFVVDVSRGGIVDHGALVAALREHKIAGAALDVYPNEPLPPDSLLWKLPNVLLTPHVAGISSNYDERAVDLFIVNLNHYLDQSPLVNQIDLSWGY